MNEHNHLVIPRISEDLDISDLESSEWHSVRPVSVNQYWSGEAAPDHRGFYARLLWSHSALYARFDAAQREPLVVISEPDVTRKTIGLWERDVCEIFVAPDASRSNTYFEFEVAPTGEWLDVAVETTSEGRRAVWEHISGMTAAARIEAGRVIMAMRIPFEGLETHPRAGQVWRGNLFRCVGSGDTRGYLAWQPTMTEKPNFHVPEAFGEFHFAE